MRRPAEEPGALLEPSGNRRPREMVTPDRIRLTGLLRKPLQMQGFLFGRASPVHHARPTSRSEGGRETLANPLFMRILCPRSPTWRSSDSRLLNEEADPAGQPSQPA
jgi:hypothetical protein